MSEVSLPLLEMNQHISCLCFIWSQVFSLKGHVFYILSCYQSNILASAKTLKTQQCNGERRNLLIFKVNSDVWDIGVLVVEISRGGIIRIIQC